MEDAIFLNILQCSVGWKGTILDGIADKYIIFPTEQDGLNMCQEAHVALTRHYETLYMNEKDTLDKVKTVLSQNVPELKNITASQRGTYYTVSSYDPNGNRMMFRKIIYCYKQLQKIENDILEKKLLDQFKAEMEIKKQLIKTELKAQECASCPVCKK